MGTTVVGALFSAKKHKMFIGHVGDSRAYRIREGEIKLMTRDHSLVNDYLLAMPELSEEQRSELPKNVITRALGMQDHVSVDLQSDDTRSGDVYVLCSDGLSGMINDEEILNVVQTAPDLAEACRMLIAMANEHGGEDNITCVVVRIEDDPPGTERIDVTPPAAHGPVAVTGTDEGVETADTPPAGVPAVQPVPRDTPEN
jgi:protein phosphatase